MTVLSRIAAVVVLSLSAVTAPQAAELIVVPSRGNGPGLHELAAGFSRHSGHKVTVVNEKGKTLAKRVSEGPADLLTFHVEGMQALMKQGRVINSTVTSYMMAGLGVGVRAGAPKPDIGTVEKYRAALLAAKSIGYSGGCSGDNVAWGIAQLGLTEQLKPKTKITDGRIGPVTFFLARGDFELGIQQSNVMVSVPGADYVGPVPGHLNRACENQVGVATVSKQPELAREMIRFMISPAAAPLLRKAHEQPIKG